MPKRLTTERARAHWNRFAPRYDRAIASCDRMLKLPDGRWWVTSRARGDVLEVGAGTGLNFTLYPKDVRLTAIDLSPGMLERARRRASEIGRDVDIRVADAHALDFGDASFDTVVFSLSLCSIPDDRRAVAEGVRVLMPGGRMLLLEHVRSPNRIINAVQWVVEPLSVRFQADHLRREPLDHLHAEGMEIEEVQRWSLGVMEQISARKPSP